MLFKVDVDNFPLLYIEADGFGEVEQMIKEVPLIKDMLPMMTRGLKLNSISPIEDKCYIKKDLYAACTGCFYDQDGLLVDYLCGECKRGHKKDNYYKARQ